MTVQHAKFSLQVFLLTKSRSYAVSEAVKTAAELLGCPLPACGSRQHSPWAGAPWELGDSSRGRGVRTGELSS